MGMRGALGLSAETAMPAPRGIPVGVERVTDVVGDS